MSLAQPLSHQSSMFNPAGFNPFGPNAILGSDQVLPRLSPAPGLAPPETIHAPQGRVPTNVASLAPPPSQSRPESRPDFMRGFGVEIPEEEEPEEVPHVQEEVQEDEAVVETAEADMSMASVEETDQEDEQDGLSTVAQSRIHSRHISKLSVALSLRSVGGMVDDDGTIPEHEVVPVRSPTGEMEVEDLDGDGDVDADQEAVGEWTGSEDLRTGPETSDDEASFAWQSLYLSATDVHTEHRRMVKPFRRGACTDRAPASPYDASREAGQAGARDTPPAAQLPASAITLHASARHGRSGGR